MEIGDRFSLKDGRVVEAIPNTGYLLGLKERFECGDCCLLRTVVTESGRTRLCYGEEIKSDCCLNLGIIFKFVEE